MINPYEVIGVKENATIDEIKKAYRQQARKYHPDQYGDNPLKNLAEDKMKELNEAYDYLMKNQASKGSSNNYSSNNNSQSGYDYNRIRMDIRSGNLAGAEATLNNIKIHDAEWNYLMGLIYIQKGWQDAGFKYVSTAARMAPSNQEYRDTLNFINKRNTNYRQQYYGQRGGDVDFCNVCLNLWCLDSICECFGGDLIGCC
ncbi:DnaJ domain-containing protein [Clostridium sediminicola]|uniref:J domain-containing protein n=1 Tax=Clostridium sediminicola TaxID=3114879 RepID=UPI0031F1FAE6